MRIMPTCVLMTLVLIQYDRGVQAQSPPSLLAGYRVHEYFAESYTAQSRQGFVFFAGEPITFKLIVRNVGDGNTSFMTPVAGALFQVQAYVASVLSPVTAPGSRYKYQDEKEIDLPVVFSSPMKAWAGGTFDIQLGREAVLDPGEGIELLMTVPSSELGPGLYRFVVKVNGTDRSQRPVQSFANFGFELRPGGVEDEPEIRRREALRYLFKEDYPRARQAVAELLRMNPNSYDAYRALEMIAKGEGRNDEAAKHRSAADVIKNGDRDELLRKFRTQGPRN